MVHTMVAAGAWSKPFNLAQVNTKPLARLLFHGVACSVLEEDSDSTATALAITLYLLVVDLHIVF